MQRIIACLLLAATVLVGHAYADCAWQVNMADAYSIARETLRGAGYDLSTLDQKATRSTKDCEWLVRFAPPIPAAVASGPLVIVDGITGKARIAERGKSPQASNQSVELTATRRAPPFSMTRTFSLPAMPALGGGSSLLSR